MRDAVVVEAVRTPIGKGKPNGALAHVHPVELLAHTLRTLVERSGVDPALIDDVIGGTVDQVGEQAMNTTRYALLSAGFPESVPATTVDRQCGSSQQAVHFAAQGVMAGAYDLVVACGVESMSRVPMWSNVPPGADPFGPGVAARYPQGLVPQGISAELIAAKWSLSRERMDAFAVSSHQKAATAHAAGRFDAEIAPLDGVSHDECVRPDSSVEVLAGLRPAYHDPAFAERFPQIGWNVTAGNASPVNDGASAVLITSGDTAARLGLRPLARLHSFAVTGSDPLLMLTGVVPATEKVLRRASLSLGDIDLFEVNEAFASVVLAWQRETGADLAKVNVHGGAIALGHPLGASGTRLTTTLVHALHERGARYGLQTMCEAGGLANAMILEAV
ncbi:acetyl-CoA C-acyltransferase [Streptomyces violaceoruber]|uniref:3-ketoacyl-CoA thiolase/acetyl-CoA acetyltransferase n=1 Tax=Streptomyces coelicolor (strain ATCC BAA-471 / A3(2) / M145) TaxID=100226 RepID=Q9K409_STRCO|nr:MULTISPECIES: thiolase family protein [Streptomyces]MDX2923389.1 thiolase family protein [Streptomyces sp. NRRL_B-16638]MYU40849.1 acetyl-CoA C-acyltransferase [Streptomyces sp. SID7813]NSL80777.1 thiolase family protein [Streptomyces coelicolor]PSK48750.1 3-ketoacyl-CoA thiolase [Streptomyces sp. 111WW2]QFI41541.1 thiolase family protein [Streptomyces coelicolor A3(2)]